MSFKAKLAIIAKSPRTKLFQPFTHLSRMLERSTHQRREKVTNEN